MPSDPTGREHLTPVKIKDTSATERAGFRRCRRQWFLTTVHRLDPNEPNVNFFVGNLFHEAMRVYYLAVRDGKPQDQAKDEALDAFQAKFDADLALVKSQMTFLADVAEPVYREAGELAFDMAQNYIDAEPSNPVLAKIVAVEFRVRVAIRNPKTGRRSGWLSVQADLVGEDDAGDLAVVDHKTRSRAVNMAHVDLDDQLTAEAFAWFNETGRFPEKAILNVAFKRKFGPPKRLKDKKDGTPKLSKAKDQGTTHALYVQALDDLGLDHAEYADILGTLREAEARGESQLFHREETFRTPGQIAAFERDLFYEFQDMKRVAAHPEQAYPSPSEFNCGRCPVRVICTTIQDDGDVEAVIQAGFVVGDPRR